jgi:hypothetical protein
MLPYLGHLQPSLVLVQKHAGDRLAQSSSGTLQLLMQTHQLAQFEWFD